FQILVAVFIAGAGAGFTAAVFTARHQPAVAYELFRTWKARNVADFGQDRPSTYFAQPRHPHEPLACFAESSLFFNFIFMPHNVPAKLANLPRSEEHTSELQSRFDIVC